MTSPEGADECVTVSVDLRVGAEEWHVEVPVPEGPATPLQLLPVLHVFADAVTGVAAREAEAAGLTISCRKGCGACCRQLAPVSESEAVDIRRLVEDLPADRRETILARFAAARSRLEEGGLLGKLLAPEGFTRAELKTLGLDYFRLGIPCPFLEEEACSIHPDRPLICREYLVTSPPALCADPSPAVRRVPLPAPISRPLLELEADPNAQHARWVPLSLALDGPTGPAPVLPERTGPQLLQELLRRAVGSSAQPIPDRQ